MKALINKVMLTLSSLLVAGGLTFAVAAVPVHAQDCSSGVGQGVALTTDDPVNGCKDNNGESFSAVVKKVINIFSVVVGAVSVIMIIIGGFRYIVSNGESGAVTGAKNAILYAIIGLIIVLFAQLIVRFVLTSMSETT